MKDEDLIEGIKRADAEKLKQALIDELSCLRKTSETDATFWNAFRSCLRSALKRAGIKIPS